MEIKKVTIHTITCNAIFFIKTAPRNFSFLFYCFSPERTTEIFCGILFMSGRRTKRMNLDVRRSSMNKNYTLKTLLFSFRKFPVTLPCIWLFTILLIANIHVPFILYQQFISEILTFLFCFGTISFFIDALFLRRQRSKWYFFTLFLGILLSLLFVWLEIRASFIPYFDFFQYY